eukprot:NODE_24961_length_604_cov_3.127883.p1 GENE.NODE_24961_length_604_cov_3.127883~~NODE_24961_length_604_cov_3.127883.p1  ORF type:complete len:169 (+),score=8.02 NODE_24961_length_604_cov_3.127883:1-507(+)
MWGREEKVDDCSSSSISNPHPVGHTMIPTGMDVLLSDSEHNSSSIANIANEVGSSRAMVMNSHREGTCAPCRFHAKATGCLHGANCHYCHEPHDATQAQDRVRRPRPNKTVRAKCKAAVRAAASAGMTLHDGESASSSQSVRTSYLAKLMKAQLRTDADQHDEESPSP